MKPTRRLLTLLVTDEVAGSLRLAVVHEDTS